MSKKCRPLVLLNDSLLPWLLTVPERRRIIRNIHIYAPKYKSKALLGVFVKCYRPEICSLMGSYAVCSGTSSPTFRDNLSVLSSSAKNPESSSSFLKLDPIGCRETSVSYHYTLRNNPEEHRSHLHRGGSPNHAIGLLRTPLLWTHIFGTREPETNQ